MRQDQPPSIRVGKTSPAANGDVYTLTIGDETTRLLPFKNWNQLDEFKWTVRGKLPATPAGLEVGPDHVKLTGETVSIHDPDGCARLERLFADWLELEYGTLELANRSRVRASSVIPEARDTAPMARRFRVERDRLGQIHIHCLEGANTIATIGLTLAGFNSLVHQGLMRKPHRLQVGALHDWVEFDGITCDFKNGRDDSARLEQLLNERYLAEAHAEGYNVLIFENPVSPTGFDIQFPAIVGGVRDQRRVHLTDESVNLLQDQDHCGLLHKRIIVKLIPPNIVFKQKTSNGGEEYLPKTTENAVRISGEAGAERLIHLSQPLNLLRLSAPDLTAVFNHPAINQRGRLNNPPAAAADSPLVSLSPPAAVGTSGPPLSTPELKSDTAAAPALPAPAANTDSVEPVRTVPQALKEDAAGLGEPALLPNVWLKDLLAIPSVRHDWFACLIYSQMAQKFGNSSEGKFGPSSCWSIALGEARDIADPAFKGIFLTEKGSFGFLNQGHLARFYNGVAFLGTQHSALEGIGITLVAVGLDARENIVFIVTKDYRSKFGVSAGVLAALLERLKQFGVVVFGTGEALASNDPLEMIWTVPVAQSTPNDPQALESVRPRQ